MGCFVRGWVPENENKLWFAPLHTEEMPGLTIRAIPLARPEKARTIEYRHVAWTTSDGDPFYPGEIRLPEAGIWRLIATSGPDWGCFEMTLPG